jgi:hypothetical protein
VRNIVAGVVLIAIGLIRGDSVFLGDFSILPIIFDALGVFFIIKGVAGINRAKREGASQPPAPPPPASRPR